MGVIQVLGAAAGLFALMLVALPSVRVAQGQLPVRSALGLWISGLGFALLAAAALLLSEEAARAAILAGVVAAVVGNIVQRRTAGREHGR
jgi:formate-dependent phosphoribosylglycinamide formyltransferase (GAR transformylase)